MDGTISNRLRGHWVNDPADISGIRSFGHVTLVFARDRTLRYTIHLERRDQIVLMTYEVVGDHIVTNQASAPSEQVTGVKFTDEGRLVLSFGDDELVLIRESTTRSILKRFVTWLRTG